MQTKTYILIFYSVLIGLVSSVSSYGASRIVQSLVIEFPINGRVIVQAREEIGKNPRLLLISEHSGNVLCNHTISANDDWLKPQADKQLQHLGLNPFLRFRGIRAKGFNSPLILAVAVAPGGSDHAFFGVVIGEIEGNLVVLTRPSLFTSVQGGFFLGYLNKHLGYGLISWRFLWNEGAHYDYHRYEIEFYKLKGNRFVRQRRYDSKRRYYGDGSEALRELGIKAFDQRVGIPKMKDYLE
jgi:hypothetical protein